MIGEILGALNIIEKFGKFINWARNVRVKPPDTVSSRFVDLFECHDVHRNQIPRFFGHGLTIADVQNEAMLLKKLDEPLLDAACRLFAVRREWLDGAESAVYPCHDFYKHPEEVAPFLNALQESNPVGAIDGTLIAPLEREGDALILLSEVIGEVGDKPIYRYHLCNNWLFDYWKSRAYLTAFVAAAWKQRVYIRGTYLPRKEIKKIAWGEVLLSAKNGRDPICGRGPWYPEDMALKPTAFLSGVDPERDKFGTKSALELWLKLEEQDYMAMGLSMYQSDEVRRSFEEALRGV